MPSHNVTTARKMRIWETCREFLAKGLFFFYISWRTFNFSATAQRLSHNVPLGMWNLDSSCRPKFFLPKIQNFNACRPKILVKKYLIEKFNFPKNLVWTVEYRIDNPTLTFSPKIWSLFASLLKEIRKIQIVCNTIFFPNLTLYRRMNADITTLMKTFGQRSEKLSHKIQKIGKLLL